MSIILEKFFLQCEVRGLAFTQTHKQHMGMVEDFLYTHDLVQLAPDDAGCCRIGDCLSPSNTTGANKGPNPIACAFIWDIDNDKVRIYVRNTDAGEIVLICNNVLELTVEVTPQGLENTLGGFLRTYKRLVAATASRGGGRKHAAMTAPLLVGLRSVRGLVKEESEFQAVENDSVYCF